MPETCRGTASLLQEGMHLSLEFRLLVACSWQPPQSLACDQEALIASLIREGIDWDYFRFLVKRHAVPVQAHTLLRRHASLNCPPAILNYLKAHSVRSASKALRHAQELLRLITRCAQEGIEILPLKGVPLSLELYQNPCMRHSSDLDIMVREADVDRVEALLLDAGYTCLHWSREASPRQREYHRKHFYHDEYRHHETAITVELHWNCYLWPRELAATLWDNSRHISFGGMKLPTLSWENQLIFLSEHGSRHRWVQLKWVSDIAMIVARAQETDLLAALHTARLTGAHRILAHTLLLVEYLYNLPLSEQVRAIIRSDPEVTLLSKEAVHALLSDDPVNTEARKPFIGLRRLRLMMRLRPSLHLKQILQKTLISPSDFKRFPLPDRLFWCYLPLRPLFWLLRRINSTEH